MTSLDTPPQVIPISRGRGFRPAAKNPMPVSRVNMLPLAGPDTMQFRALVDLANFADALEQAIGARIGPASAGTPAPPPAASWDITAGDGHFRIEIAPQADRALLPPVQHQIACANDQRFDTHSSSVTYTLGLGETSRDIVEPGSTRYWRLRSRYPGTEWNAWRPFATAAGVVALSPGVLKTS